MKAFILLLLLFPLLPTKSAWTHLFTKYMYKKLLLPKFPYIFLKQWTVHMIILFVPVISIATSTLSPFLCSSIFWRLYPHEAFCLKSLRGKKPRSSQSWDAMLGILVVIRIIHNSHMGLYRIVPHAFPLDIFHNYLRPQHFHESTIGHICC